MNDALKSIGAVILGIAAFVILIFLGILFVQGTVWIGDKILPFLTIANGILIIVCIVLLPFMVFRAGRILGMWVYMIASAVFGVSTWIFGFLVTYDLWGIPGILIGLVFAGVGVVPLGIIAAALHGIWSYVAQLVFGIVLVIGTRLFSVYLAQKVDAAAVAI